MTDARAGAPAYLLIASGLINVLYSGFYALWTLMPIGIVGLAQISIVMDGTQGVGEALMAFLLLSMIPLIQLVGFFVTFVMGAITIFGGMRLNTYRSKGVVWLAILCSTGAPVLALMVNAASALNISAMGMGCITGCLLGNIPTLLVLIVGLIASGLAGFHLFSDDARAEYV